MQFNVNLEFESGYNENFNIKAKSFDHANKKIDRYCFERGKYFKKSTVKNLAVYTELLTIPFITIRG